MKDSAKRKMLFWCWVPVALFVAWLLYILIINGGLIGNGTFHEHEKVVTMISHNYGGSFVLFMAAFLMGLSVLLYLIVHLARVPHINAGTKLGWIIFLSVFAPFSFPIFYYVEVRNEPENLKLYESIV